jgi:proline iminopeptidase
MKPYLFFPLYIVVLAFAGCPKQAMNTRLPISTPIQEVLIPAKDATIYSRAVGRAEDKPTLLLINGGPGLSHHSMTAMDPLAANTSVRLVSYDQRGVGRSSKPKSGGYSLEHYVSDVESIREFYKEDKLYLLGHSWGGIIALAYAAKYPNHIGALILVGSGPVTFSDLEEGAKKMNVRITDLQNHGLIPTPLPESSREHLMAILPAYFSNPRFTIPPEIKNTLIDAEVSSMTSQSFVGYDLRSKLASFAAPVLVLVGSDNLFGVDMSRSIIRNLKGAQTKFVVLKHCGHFPWCECSKPFYAEVQSFIRDLRRIP